MLTPETIIIENGEFAEPEIQSYIRLIRQKHPGVEIEEIRLKATEENGEPYVDISYRLRPVKFERIRRITGYLVGSLDRFNDAKRSEVADRVSHTGE